MSIRVRDLVGTNADPDVDVVLSTIRPVTATAREAGYVMRDAMFERVRRLFPDMPHLAAFDMARNIEGSAERLDAVECLRCAEFVYAEYAYGKAGCIECIAARQTDEANAAEEALAQADGDEDAALEMLREAFESSSMYGSSDDNYVDGTALYGNHAEI